MYTHGFYSAALCKGALTQNKTKKKKMQIEKIEQAVAMSTFFAGSDIDDIMQVLITAIERKVFPEGAPVRPITDLGTGDSTQTTTSLGLAIKSRPFASAPIHVPNGGGGPKARHSFKSELSLFRDPAVGTKKILWWHSDDPRATPHNHPWDFRSAILQGGYTEQRYWLSGGRIKHETIKFVAGMINTVPGDVFHNVTEILPGTVTYMDCGPAREGNKWGYMELGEAEYIPSAELVVPDMQECFLALNPHLIKK